MMGGSPLYSRRAYEAPEGTRRNQEELGGIKLISDGAFAAAGLNCLGFEYKNRYEPKGKEWPRPGETQQGEDRSKGEEEG